METTNGDSFFVIIVISICFLISFYFLNKLDKPFIFIEEKYNVISKNPFLIKNPFLLFIIYRSILVMMMMTYVVVCSFFWHYLPKKIIDYIL